MLLFAGLKDFQSWESISRKVFIFLSMNGCTIYYLPHINEKNLRVPWIDLFKEFFERDILNRFISKTFCLIPKKDKANWVKDFRPISLITSVYKILAKVLANHLRKVLPSTISDSQGAFIVGRKILDQALLTNEAVEDYRAKRKEGVVFKIDFEKAHDHVDWDFLDKVMDEKG